MDDVLALPSSAQKLTPKYGDALHHLGEIEVFCLNSSIFIAFFGENHQSTVLSPLLRLQMMLISVKWEEVEMHCPYLFNLNLNLSIRSYLFTSGVLRQKSSFTGMAAAT